MRETSGEEGFTLVEMLVALALLALIASAIAGGVQLGRLVWQRDADLERRGEAEAAARALAGLVASAYPAGGALEGGRPRIVFEGRGGGLRFISLSEGYAQLGGLIETEIGLDGGSGGEGGAGRLMVWTAPYRAETAGGIAHETMHATEIARGVHVLAFSYYGSAEDGASQPPLAWRKDWTGRARLPHLVSVRLALEGRTGPIEVPFTVEPVQR